jgi:hypothetical protein
MLKIALRRLSHIIICPYHPLCGFERGFYRKRRDSLHDVIGDRLVDSYAADSYALARANVCIVAAALIPMRMARRHSIEHMHDPATTTASHKAS